MREVTEVFFQLTALTSDRVELGESDAVIQLSLTCSSMEGIVSWSNVEMSSDATFPRMRG